MLLASSTGGVIAVSVGSTTGDSERSTCGLDERGMLLMEWPSSDLSELVRLIVFMLRRNNSGEGVLATSRLKPPVKGPDAIVSSLFNISPVGFGEACGYISTPSRAANGFVGVLIASIVACRGGDRRILLDSPGDGKLTCTWKGAASLGTGGSGDSVFVAGVAGVAELPRVASLNVVPGVDTSEAR